jgi:regulator of sigma E protease
MTLITTILAFLFLVGVIITIHEGGHFFTGRLVGMKMLEFSIGFGPKIYENEFCKKGDNFKFTLRLLPLGGFVKPLDKTTVTPEEWDKLSEVEKSRAYPNCARWKRFLMVAGGPLSNFILAFIIYVLSMFIVGIQGVDTTIGEIVPNTVASQLDFKVGDKILEINGDKIEFLAEAFPVLVNSVLNMEKVKIKTDRADLLLDYTNVDLNNFKSGDIGKIMGFYFKGTDGKVSIDKVKPNSPAEKAGLLDKDLILMVNKEKINDLNTLIRRIGDNPEKEVVMTILRGEKELDIKIIPEVTRENGDKVGKIGVELSIPEAKNNKVIKYGFFKTVSVSFEKTYSTIYTTFVSIKNLIVGKLSTKAISGPMSIADLSGKTFERGMYSYLMMMASISVAIGAFNLLPVPALDGGHLLQFTVEFIIRRDLPEIVLKGLQYVGVFVLSSLFAFSIINDVLKYIL